MSINNYTCKISIVGSDSVCILNSEWSNTEIKLILLHENQAWNGQFQIVENEEISELLDQLSLTNEGFVEETRNALTTHGGADNFAYTIENNKFTWKKFVRKNMAVKFGYAHLLKVPVFEILEKVIDNILQSNSICNEKLHNSDKQREALQKENNHLKSKLEEFIEKKNEIETELYSKFLHVLNEKKKKIQELRKKVPDIMEGENGKDIFQSMSDHFNSDTEIDSGEEEMPSTSEMGVRESRGSMDIEDEPVTLPKRSRQKRQNVNITNSRKQSSKGKGSDSKDAPAKKVAGESRKSQRTFGKTSCVMGQMSEGKVRNNSEESEDAFIFPKRSKQTKNSVRNIQPSTSKIKYESDDETDLERFQLLGSDSDNTPSQINPVEDVNGIVKLDINEEGGRENKNVKQENCSKKMEINVISDEPKCKEGNAKVTQEDSRHQGLSSSTLEILNQLI